MCAGGASTTRPARSSASRSAETAQILRDHSIDIAPLTAQLQIEHVLTAHPTEATRRSVLDHQWDVAALLDRLDDPRIGHMRRRVLLDELREVLTVWWQTDELRRMRPKVEDEVRRNLFFFEAVLFDTVPGVLDEIEHQLGVAARAAGPVLRLAGPAATWTAIPRSAPTRWPARCGCIAGTRCGCCARAWTSWRRCSRTPRCGCRCRRSSTTHWRQDAEELPSAAVLRRPHREWEPLRTKLGFVFHRLDNTLRPRGREPGYADAQALRRDLELVLAHLNSRHVARGSIRRLLWQVDVFGFHLAGIDIRQGAGVVREAASALLPGFADADERAPPGAADGGAGERAARDPARSRRRGG